MQAAIERFRASPVLLRVGVFALLAALMFFAVGALTAALAWPWSRLAMGLVATVIAWQLNRVFRFLDHLDAEALGIAFRAGTLTRLGVGIGIGLVLVGAHLGVTAMAGGGLELQRNPAVGLEMLAVFAATYLGLSAMEEFAFRGYAMRVLDARYGLWVAQIVIALLFGLYHVAMGQELSTAMLGTGMGSLCFGMAAMASRGLALPIGLHAAWNYVGWLVGQKSDAGPWALLIDEAAIPQAQTAGMISYFAVLGTATVVFWWWYRKRVAVTPV